jgi:hypothetical protein
MGRRERPADKAATAGQRARMTPAARKTRPSTPFSAKIDKLFTYLQGVLRNRPSAPFSLDRH